MFAFVPRNPESAVLWERALRMVRRGVPNPRIIRATGIKPSTFYRRMQWQRADATWRPAVARDGQLGE